MFNHRVTVDHDAIIRAAKRFGYQIDERGLCFGIASMAMQAILVEQLKEFDIRLMKIMLAIHRPQYASNLNQGDLNDMRAFFEGVLLCQEPEKYQDFFSDPIHKQESNKALPLVASKMLEEKGGIEMFSSICTSFNENEFEQLLRDMKNNILSVTSQPTAMLVQGYVYPGKEGHAVTIGYNPKEESWYFIDANQLPSLVFKNEKDITEKISKIYKHEQEKKFSVNLMPFSIPDNTISAKFQALQNKLLNRVHPVSKNTIPDRADQELLRLAVECRSVGWVNVYLENDALKIEKYNDAPIMLYAVNAGNLEIINSLFDYLPSVSYLSEELNIAVRRNDIEIVQSFLNHGVNPNKECKEGKSALHLAVEAGNLPMCELLIEHGADIEVATSVGKSPVEMASGELREFLMKSAENHAVQLLGNVKEYIETFPWRMKFGGKKIKLDDGREVLVPENVKKQWEKIKLAESGKMSWHQAANEVVKIAQSVGVKLGRKEEAKKYYGFFSSGDLSAIRENLREQDKDISSPMKKKK